MSAEWHKYMALDLGEKRIGVALTDNLRLVAEPYEVFRRTSRRADYAHIGETAVRENVSRIVVGLPVLLGGEEGTMARWARDYGRGLSEAINISVVFWDESLTSQQAEQAMREAGYSSKKMRGKLDAVAAAFILRSYLEANRP